MTPEERAQEFIRVWDGCMIHGDHRKKDISSALVEIFRQVEAESTKTCSSNYKTKEQAVEWPSDDELHEIAQDAEEIGALDAESWEEGALWVKQNTKLRSVDDVRAEARRVSHDAYLETTKRAVNMELKAQVLVDALKYYADQKNWYPVNSHGHKMVIGSMDTIGNEWVGGHHARQALKNWRAQ